MPDLYDMSLLTDQTSFIGQFLVINFWSEGILIGGIICAFVAIIIAGVMYADKPLYTALGYGGWFGGITSMLGWLWQYNGEHAVNTLFPIFFAFMLGAALVLKLMEGSLKQLD